MLEQHSYTKTLLKRLVKTDFKLRYQGSVLGYLWSLLKPLFMFAILYVVFVVIVGVDYGVDNDGVYLLLGIVLWSFFAEVTGGSVTSIVISGDLIRKISFPRQVIVQAIASSATINLVLNMLVVLVFMLIGGVVFSWTMVLSALLFAQLLLLSLGVGYFLSAIFVRLRDINYIWDVFTQALFYLTPILFPISFAPQWLQQVLMLSPMAQIIQDMRYLYVSPNTQTVADVFSGNELMRAVPVALTLVIFVAGARFFQKRSKSFAEEL